jgi:hypothetical protein
LLVMKAIGLSWSTAKTVLLLCAGEGGLSSNALEERRLLFNRLKQSTAQQVVEFQRKRQRPPSAG